MLQRGDSHSITEYMESLEKGTDVLMDHAINIIYYMRGSIQFDDIFNRTYYERMKMMEFIKKHLEAENKKVKDSKGKLSAIY
jgi:hypothetical protein